MFFGDQIFRLGQDRITNEYVETKVKDHNLGNIYLNYYSVKSNKEVNSLTTGRFPKIYTKSLKTKGPKHTYSSESYSSIKSINLKGKKLERLKYDPNSSIGRVMSRSKYDEVFPEDISSKIKNGKGSKKAELISSLDLCIKSRSDFRSKCILPCGFNNENSEDIHHIDFIEKIQVFLANLRD